MIIGIGNDLVDIRRIEQTIARHGDAFIARCFTPREQEIASSKPDQAAYYAKRFAAKEAFLKALGTGFANGISWQDISISNDEKGKPLVDVSGKAAQHLDQLVPDDAHVHIHLSLSDEPPYAQSFIIIEAITHSL